MINVSAALCSHTSQPAMIERTTAGAYVDGIWKDGVIKKIRCLASIQPIEEDIQTTDGHPNQVTEERWTVYCNKALIGTDPEKETTGDILVYKKRRYRVMGETDWTDYGYGLAIVALIPDYKPPVT